MTDWTKIVSGLDLVNASKERSVSKIIRKDLSEAEANVYVQEKQWTLDRKTKKGKCTISKNKNIHDVFENEIWLLLYKMGFTRMNKDNGFCIQTNCNSKQIDVFAMDDDTCIFVECKAAESPMTNHSFKDELEAIHGHFPDICEEVTKQFGIRQFKYIFATKNYLIGDDSADMNRIKGFGLSYINEDVKDYYYQLVDHLGKAARYQFFGNIFSKKEIPGLDCSVPALRGTMGGLKYYSFLIEPERLLKIAYILHLNKANHDMMPTYQRLIKKDRLKSIREFIKTGGYFPNSLIISIDENVSFEAFSEKALSQMGILRLPAKYSSVYVIDGQHRLYGYSETAHSTNNVIPVVAFERLEKNTQVKMFMDINENQKKVSKTIRNILRIDLLSGSSIPNEQKESLMLRIADNLGEDKKSPLYGRVVTGEDKTTNIRCITTEYLKDAIKHSSFLNEYNKAGSVIRYGTFDKNEYEPTRKFLSSFIYKCLSTIRSLCSEKWELGNESYLTINNTMYAVIRIINDIVNIELAKTEDSIVLNVDDMYDKCEPLLLDLIDTIDNLDLETSIKIKKAKGGGAKKEAWRLLQVALTQKNSEFTNDDLKEYILENCTDYTPQANEYITKLRAYFISKLKEKITSSDWIHKYVSPNVGTDISTRLAAHNFSTQKQDDYWDIITFEDISHICSFSNNWSSFAQVIMHRSSSTNKTKGGTLNWIKDLSVYYKKLSKGDLLSRTEFQNLEAIYRDFILVSNETEE